MQRTVLKEVLSLLSTSEAAKWNSAEQQVIQQIHSIGRHDLVKVAKHFGVNQKGSQLLWKQIDEQVLRNFSQLSIEEANDVVDAFGENQSYQLSDQLDQKLSATVVKLAELEIQKECEKNPYYVDELVQKIRMQAPPEFEVNKLLKQPNGDEYLFYENPTPLIEFPDELSLKGNQYNRQIVEVDQATREFILKHESYFLENEKNGDVRLSDYIKYK